jgi:hypothetical protein
MKGMLAISSNVGCGTEDETMSSEAELRDRIIAFIERHQRAVLSAVGVLDVWAMPICYQNRGVEIGCLVPRWADLLYHIEEDPRVTLVIASGAECLHWVQYWGVARPVNSAAWRALHPSSLPTRSLDELYQVLHITPRRIDLVDERAGWGRRENLDC